MPQSLRKLINPEDGPDDQSLGFPSYFTPVDDNNGLPDYFKPLNAKPVESERDKEKKKHTFFGDLKKSIGHPIDDFVNSMMSKKPEERNFLERLIASEHPGAEPVAPSAKTLASGYEPDTYTGGFIHGLYNELIRPLSSMEGVAGLYGAEEGLKSPKTPTPELPIKQAKRELPYRMGGSSQKPELADGTIGSIKMLRNSEIRDVIKDAKSKLEAEKTPTIGKRINSIADIADEEPSAGRKINTIDELREGELPVRKPTVGRFITDTSEIADSKPTGKRIENIEDIRDQTPPIKTTETPTELPVKQEVKPNFVNPFEKKTHPLENSNDIVNMEGGFGPKLTKEQQEELLLKLEKLKSEAATDQSGRLIAPPQEIPTRTPLKAPGTEFTESVSPITQTSDQLPVKRDILRDFTGEKYNPDVHDQAIERFGMGQAPPETTKQKAEFLALNEQKEPMYNIVEPDGTRSTFTGPEELIKRGIEVPETPKDAVPMRGEDIRNKMIADQKAKSAESWKAPDYFKPAKPKIEDNENLFPQEMRAKQKPENVAMGGADPRVLDILGTTLYSKNRPLVAVKELLQNSLDEHRISGQTRPIKVHFNREDMNPRTDKPASSITVRDFGRGMTPEQIYTVLTDVGKSGKIDEAGASGGFGFAKASPMLGGNFSRFESVINEKGQRVKYSFEGSPTELKNQEFGVQLKREVVDFSTPTGFKATVYYKEGEGLYSAKNQVKHMGERSLSNSSPIELSQTSSASDKPKADKFLDDTLERESPYYKYYVDKHEQKSNPPVQDTIKVPGADIDIHYDDAANNKAQEYDMHILNNGMYQFDDSGQYSPFGAMQGVPSEIKVNVKPNVEEGLEGYPFSTNREQLADTVRTAVGEWIQKNLVSGALEKQKQSLLDMYANMKPVSNTPGSRPTVIFDPHKLYSSAEMSALAKEPFIKDFTTFTNNVISTILNAVGREGWNERLEKVGVTLDPNVHGIHIPHPETGKSVILINPLNLLRDVNDPYQSALENIATMFHETGHIGTYTNTEPRIPSTIDWSNIDSTNPKIADFFKSYMNEVKHAANVADSAHGIDFLNKLGEIYSKTGSKSFLDAAKELHEVITENSTTGNYSPEVQRVLQQYSEKAGSTSFEKDILSRTGEQSAVRRGGKGGNEGNDRPNGKGASAESAVGKLFSALEDARGRTAEQEAINSAERSKRFSEFSKVKQTGAKGAAQSLSKLRGEFEKVNPGDRLSLNQQETDSLFTAVKLANITPGEKARGYTALFKILNGDGNPVRSELAILDDVFGNGFANKITELHGGIGAVGVNVAKTANTMKVLQSSMDVSAPLRQGLGLITRREFGPALRDMFKFYADREFYNESMKAIQERPNYLLGRDAELFIAKPGSLESAEEAFLNSYVGQIPGINRAVAASERAYTGFLNKLRADTFDNMIARAKELGVDVGDETAGASKEAKAIARFINTATGRGKLPGRLNRVTNELNTVLWSPKLIASRIEMLTNPKIYTDLPKGMRMEGLRSLFGIAALGLAVDGLSKAAGGASISGDILSTDFGKSRFGNQVLDPWGGFQQYIVAAARFLAGKTDSRMPVSRLQIAGRFAANKESPIASLAHTLLTAKKFTGDSNNPKTAGNFITEYGQETSVQSEVAKRFIPMFIENVNELVQANPKWAEDIGLTAALTGASALGMGVQNYPERKKSVFGKMKVR